VSDTTRSNELTKPMDTWNAENNSIHMRR
jgi:hypothetical protein